MKNIFGLLMVLLIGLQNVMSQALTEEPTAKVQWISFEEAFKKQQEEPRKIFVDIYTDWCGWCKRMDAATFSHPVIAKYLNTHYYAIKFNAEQKEDIVFQGHTFVNQNPSANRNAHDLAAAFLQGKMGYPSVVFIDEKSNVITSVQGFKQPTDLEPILYFFWKDLHLTTPWEDFVKTFVTEIK